MQDTKFKHGMYLYIYYDIFLMSEEQKKIDGAIKNFFNYSKIHFKL